MIFQSCTVGFLLTFDTRARADGLAVRQAGTLSTHHEPQPRRQALALLRCVHRARRVRPGIEQRHAASFMDQPLLGGQSATAPGRGWVSAVGAENQLAPGEH